ncbi:MAG: GNAT family N-acetyltransferase [Planctomycetes bacterium]|nr:GNAT family N-acetyltransferase [Planctomycetota bacterium]
MARIEPTTIKTRDGAPVVIRCAVAADAERMLDCVREVLAASVGTLTTLAEFQLTPQQEREWIAAYLENPNALLLVAEAQGDIVGNINFRPAERTRLAHTGTLGMGLRPAWQGRGIGHALLRTLLDWARDNPKIEKVSLQVLGNNPRAIRLYYKCGFTVNGVKPREIKLDDGSYTDDISMHIFV